MYFVTVIEELGRTPTVTSANGHGSRGYADRMEQTTKAFVGPVSGCDLNICVSPRSLQVQIWIHFSGGGRVLMVFVVVSADCADRAWHQTLSVDKCTTNRTYLAGVGWRWLSTTIQIDKLLYCLLLPVYKVSLFSITAVESRINTACLD